MRPFKGGADGGRWLEPILSAAAGEAETRPISSARETMRRNPPCDALTVPILENLHALSNRDLLSLQFLVECLRFAPNGW
jgi:hypothetical protein